MTLNNFLTLFGGVALFLFGMNIMGNGLEKLSGGRLERILERMTSNVFKGVLLGAAVTAVIQSSSATTVMVVGFVNAGIMKLGQVAGVIMGANIGTTVTSLLLSLGDISSQNVLLSLFKPVSLAPIISVAGIIMYMFIRKGRKHDIGQILLGFGVLFFGMLTMEGAVKGLSQVEGFTSLMTKFSNPLLGVMVGAILTAIIQSSSASVGILQALSASGTITFATAAPIILGQNIGTCITAMLSSIGASRNAKRTALIHLYFNVIGTVVFLTAIYLVKAFVALPLWDTVMTRGSIATFHMTFNIVTTLVMLPFSKLLVRLATATVRGEEAAPPRLVMLDDLFLSSPSVALDRAGEAVVQMMELAGTNFRLCCELLGDFDEKKLERIRDNETALDGMEVQLNQYLLRIVDRDLTDSENLRHSELLHSTGDIERIGDYSFNIAESAQLRHEHHADFSESAFFELKTLTEAVGDIISMTKECYAANDFGAALRVEPLEETIDLMTEVLKSRHIERLKRGECTAESGSLFLELLINYERIADHCANIALYMIQRRFFNEGKHDFDIHAYTHHLHTSNAEDFRVVCAGFEKQYLSPIRGGKRDAEA